MSVLNSIQKIRTLFSERSERSKIVIKNAVGSFTIKSLSIAIDFAKVPVLLTFLDTDYYGVYLTLASIVLWTHQFDFGLGTGLRYNLTEALSLKNYERGKQLVSTAYISMSAIMLLVLAVCIPIALKLNWANILNCDFIAVPELGLCVILILSVFVLQFVFELISIVLQSDQRAAISSVFKPLANLLTLVIIFILRGYFHNSLAISCVAITLPIVMVLFLANIILFTKHYHNIAPSLKDFRKECLKDIYSLGFKYFASQVSSLVVFSTASFIVSHYVNPAEAAVYNTAWTYFGSLVMFNTMILQPLVAAITDAYIKNDESWIKNIFKKIRLYSCFLTLISLLLLLISQFIFHIWVGEKIIVPWSLSIAMTAYFIFNIWVSPYQNFLSGVGKMNVMVIVSFCKIVLFFPVAITFVKTWGAIGLIYTILFVNTLPNMIIGIIQYNMIVNHTAKGIWNK